MTADATWWCAVTEKTARTAASRVSTPSRVRMTLRSASLPPTVLPTTRPRPKTTSSTVTIAGVKPLTSCRIVEMKVKATNTPPYPNRVIASARTDLGPAQHAELAADAGRLGDRQAGHQDGDAGPRR